ncbi:MAG: hypothetical protein ACR2KM_09690, partial [Gemmatimonadaceae bacterium]
IPLAALGTDIGNETSRKSDTQTQADFGAFAGAATMTDTPVAGAAVPAEVVNAVTASMNANQPQDDGQACWSANNCIAAGQLTNLSDSDGEVSYTNDGLVVVSPRARVDFGLANAFGISNVSVSSVATVSVYSPGQRVMPMFAVNGCDYGLETLVDPSGGGATPIVPPLAFPTDTTTTELQSPLVMKDSSGAAVNTLPLNSTGNSLTVTAKKWKQSNYIGFFRSDDTSPSAVVTVGVPVAPYGTGAGSASSVTVNIPPSVTSVETVWWVRVYNGDGNPTASPHGGTKNPSQWSPQSQALPVVVGQAALQCLSGPTVGNFGTIKFPRTDVPTGDDLPVNIIKGLQRPLAPHVHQWAVDNPDLSLAAGGTCVAGLNGAIASGDPSPGLLPGTNCVDTDTGLAANVATQGLIQGDQGYGGLLTNVPTRSGCDPGGGSNYRNISISGGPYKINDEVLSCYFNDGSTSINDIARKSYARVSTDGVLDSSIYSSPRFLWVPVLRVQPSGGSNHYSIIDFRPAFITDEQAIATAIRGSHTGTSDNGIMIPGEDIKQLKVVFFNANALPETGDGNTPLMPFLGVGRPIVRLVN